MTAAFISLASALSASEWNFVSTATKELVLRCCDHTCSVCNALSSGSLTNLLQKAAVNIIDQADCQQSYGSVLTSNMMCAGFMAGGRDTCLVRCSHRLLHFLFHNR